MAYYKLPTKKKQLFLTISLLGMYAVAFYYLNEWAPEVSDGAKRFLTQFGVMVIFLSGLLANIGIFWAAKVRHNKILLRAKLSRPWSI